MSLQAAIKKRFSGFSLDVSLNTNGGVMGILGASGSGKSMTLKCIAGIETPDEGRIVLNGRVLFDSEKHINLPPQKRKVGYLFQNYALFPNMTVETNIAAGLSGSKEEKQEAVARMIRLFKLEGLEKRYPSQLSGGQQQRVALARILVYEPDVIMLDEPFSALDYYLKEQLQFQVREVLRGYTGDVLMVSHSRDEVYRFCEKSIILNRGQVAMKGETRAIFQKPENVTAARLTGCKNFSRIRRIGEYEVEALDWGLTFQTEEVVAAEHAYIGIRAHQFYPARGSANEFTCEWGDTLCQPFEWDVLLRPVENAGAAGDKENALEREVIWWKVDYKQSDSLNHYQRGDRVRLGIAPGDIMLLKEGENDRKGDMYGRWENRRDHPGGRAVGAHGRIKADAPDGADHDDTEGDRHDPAGGDLANRRRDRVSGRCAGTSYFTPWCGLYPKQAV